MPSLTQQQLEAEQRRLTQLREKLHKTGTGENDNETKSEWPKRNVPMHEMKSIIPGKTIRIDGLIRNNAGINIGDIVTIRKVVLPNAEKITLVPLENIPPIDERYLADTLATMPVTKGDNVMIPYFGGRLTFQVTGVIPQVTSIVTQRTVFSISNKGPTLRTVGDFKYYSDGEKIAFFLEDAVRKESSEGNYLVLKVRLHHGGFEARGEFQIKLEQNMSLEDLVSRCKELAQEIVAAANRKLVEPGNVNSVDLINDIKFEILEKWRTV
ncbi:MAG: hypothetical protein KGL95_14195 [Patescibacteria group bacterium]|nr:hypothetical protein [Patescibacteria group bacterium]